MSITKKVLVFTATYNEKENIELLINSIFKNSPDVHVLIIDDNSPDQTSDKIEEFQKVYKNIFLIKRDKKKRTRFCT